MRQYDELYDWHVSVRSAEIGLPEVEAFVRPLAPGAGILDLGCGHGLPIARVLQARGFAVSGVDSSARMIEGFRANVPGARAACAPVQTFDFFGDTFDAVIAWGVLFHLSPADQAIVIARVAAALAPGGRFLFTAADIDVVHENPMQDLSFRYTSLGVDRYAQLLDQQGLTSIGHHCDAWDNYVYTAVKPRPPRSAP